MTSRYITLLNIIQPNLAVETVEIMRCSELSAADKMHSVIAYNLLA